MLRIVEAKKEERDITALSRQIEQLGEEKYPDLYNPEARSIENDIMLKLGGSKVYMCGNSRWVYRCESKKHN